MSIIKSTGLYGDAYLFEDVETLKILSTEHDTRIDILESDDVNSKSRLEVLEGDNTTSKSRISTLETDNTSSKSRISTLESDNTTNKSNIATLTTDTTTGDVHRYSGRSRSECVRPRGSQRSCFEFFDALTKCIILPLNH